MVGSVLAAAGLGAFALVAVEAVVVASVSASAAVGPGGSGTTSAESGTTSEPAAIRNDGRAFRGGRRPRPRSCRLSTGPRWPSSAPDTCERERNDAGGRRARARFRWLHEARSEYPAALKEPVGAILTTLSRGLDRV